jgi:hypothetical protein
MNQTRRISAASLLAGLILLTACADPPRSTGGGSPSPSPSSESNPFFATHPQGPALMQALYQGPLVVHDGCVLMKSGSDYSLPVWPEGFTAERDPTGRLIVRDAEGATIAIEGEVFEMGGGYRAEFRPEDKVEPREDQIPRFTAFLGYEIPQRCLGADVYGIWLVGETEPIAA